MTRLQNGLNLGDRASGLGINIRGTYVYLVFCLIFYKYSNFKTISSRVIFFPVMSLFWNQRVIECCGVTKLAMI